MCPRIFCKKKICHNFSTQTFPSRVNWMENFSTRKIGKIRKIFKKINARKRSGMTAFKFTFLCGKCKQQILFLLLHDMIFYLPRDAWFQLNKTHKIIQARMEKKGCRKYSKIMSDACWEMENFSFTCFVKCNLEC